MGRALIACDHEDPGDDASYIPASALVALLFSSQIRIAHGRIRGLPHFIRLLVSTASELGSGDTPWPSRG